MAKAYEIIRWYDEGVTKSLGHYKTKELAQEIVDKLRQQYTPYSYDVKEVKIITDIKECTHV